MKRKEFLELSGSFLAGSLLQDAAAPKLFTWNGALDIEARIHELRLKHSWTLSRGTWNVRRNVLLRIRKEGISGYGESAPIPRYGESAESGLAFLEKSRPILEKDIWAYRDRWREIDALADGEHAVKAALDMAILDWICKKIRLPLHRFLGLDRDRIPATTLSIGIDAVPEMQERVREAADFPVLKIKVGTKDDRAIIEGIREVTDKPLRTDANEGWKNREEALEMINWMAGMGVEFVEQPMPAAMFEDYVWLKDRVKIPVFADESLMKAADIPGIARGFHGINIKLMKCGGIQEAVRMAAVARAFDLKVMLGCMVETSAGIAAAAAVSPLVDYADLDGNLLIANDPFTGIQTVRGKVVLTDKPGLGVETGFWRE